VAGIELDVQRTADGEAVVFHDADLARLGPAGDVRRIESLPWSMLRRLRLAGGAPIPRLADVLATVAGRVPVNVELKTAAVTPAALAAIGPEDDVVLSSFEVDALRLAARLRPALPRALLTEPTERGAPLTLLAELGCAAWHASAKALTETSVHAARAAGYPVRAYTVNAGDVAVRLAGWGVTAVFTDDLDAF
jgi:glycerophosphoryl diester phosphodiesterase